MTDVALQVGVHLTLHATGILGGAWLLDRYGPDRPAAVTHALWAVAFGVLLLLPVGYTAAPGAWTVALDPTSASEPHEGPTVQALPPTAPAGTLVAAPEEGASSGAAPAGATGASSGESARWAALYDWGVRWLAPAFLLVWGGGALLLLGRLGAGLQGLWRWRRSATALGRPALIAALARQMGVRRSVSVRQSPAVEAPVAWGLFSPVILLPSAATDWSRARLTSVLLHELAHVARRDSLTHLLTRVVRACFWPNPVVWTAAAAATAAQERACDDAVLRGGVAPWAYAEHLLAVTKTLRRGPVPVNAVALDAGRQFKSRMRALLASSSSRRAPTRRELGLVVAGGALVVACASAVQIGPSEAADGPGRPPSLEAEAAPLPSAFASRTDEAASGGTYVAVTEGGDRDRPPRTAPVAYTFETTSAGRHLLWARVRAPSNDHNSLWLRVDSTRWIKWNGIETGEQWHWVQVRDADQAGRPVAFDLSTGAHRLQLGPREAGIAVDQFVVTDDWHYRPREPGAPETAADGPSRIWLEAEDGWLDASFEVEHAPTASRWRHVVARPDANSRDAPPPSGHAAYSFAVSEPGTYRLWGRVLAPSSGSNSFWLRMDDGPWIRWNDIRGGHGWQWDQVHDSDAQNAPVQFDLSSGEHRLTLAHREPHAALDRLLLTADATYRPRGPGAWGSDAPPPVSRTLSPADATLRPPMTRQTDSSSTAARAWVGVPDGPGNDAPEGGPGAATWTVSVPEAGDYVLWGEVQAPVENDNSFYVSVDGGEETAWHTPAPGKTTDAWTWDPVSRLDADAHTDPVVFSLSAGRHRIRVRNREDGTRLRRLRITNRSARRPTAVRP
jgi:beta-lactamase regulating signal transducer with metallopeptidase domain